MAFSTLFISADEAAFEYQEGDLTLDMSSQFMVSGKENVIFLVFDTVPNTWVEATINEYPDMFSVVKDFTYFNNAECNYLGTYPSMVHMLTGNPLDISLETIQDKVSNVLPENANMTIDYSKLYEVLLKLSAFRYMPDGAKARFNVGESEYSGIVSYPDNDLCYLNSSFYDKLMVNGIKVDEESNYFIFKHLNGAHEYLNDEECGYLEDATREQTIRGIFTLVGEYLTQLQEAGVYDNSTIIILTDHGISSDTQPMFFIKRKNEAHYEVQISTAPITYDELLPTVVEALGEEHLDFGQSIYDIKEGELRERVYYERALDERYPSIINSRGIKANGGNIWRKYIYVGDRTVMRKMYECIYEIIPMIDSYY